MTLFEECIVALGTECEILTKSKTDKIIKNLNELVVFNEWGRIDWSKYYKYKNFDQEEINDENSVYIIWNRADLPIIKTKMKNILSTIDDVLAVDFDTWILFENYDKIIEFYHNGDARFLDIKEEK